MLNIEEIRAGLGRFISDNYIEEARMFCAAREEAPMPAPMPTPMPAPMQMPEPMPMPMARAKANSLPRGVREERSPYGGAAASFGARAGKLSESGIEQFISDSYMENAVAKKLNQYMYERDITTAMIYERCFIDRKLISKISGSSNYHPSKNTMLALCIGLRLSLSESEEFLLLAGYSFSNTSKYELIIKYLISQEVYDIDVINEMLFQYEQPCIGA